MYRGLTFALTLALLLASLVPPVAGSAAAQPLSQPGGNVLPTVAAAVPTAAQVVPTVAPTPTRVPTPIPIPAVVTAAIPAVAQVVPTVAVPAVVPTRVPGLPTPVARVTATVTQPVPTAVLVPPDSSASPTTALPAMVPLATVPQIPVAAEKIDPALLRLMQEDPTRQLPVIVEMQPVLPTVLSLPNVQLAQRAMDLLRLHGVAVGAIPLLNGAAGFVDAAGIEALSLDRRVAYVYEDALVQPTLQREPGTAVAPGRLSAPYPRVVNADHAWREGATGRGVTVAVLDSGIAADPDLVQPNNRILARVSFVGQTAGGLADPGGHGTHVAGIIAGNGAQSEGEYVGIAPEASLVDVRVLNDNGSGRVSSVVRGIEWVLAHREQYGIRVVNLSIGAPPRTTYRTDPLAAAVEIAWRRGLVVVAAAGNRGPSEGTVDSPGIDPYVITVGATDDRDTLRTTDDLLAPFSSWGTPLGSTARPDLVAPGRRIVSLRAPGSYLDRSLADRVVEARNGTTYFRLSGTSMATPVVSGAVALLLEQRPELTPDQVKALLTGTTQAYVRDAGDADGSGLLDVRAALAAPAPPPSNQGLRPSDGFARALLPVLFGQPLVWRDPTYDGVDWGTVAWDTVAWDTVAWDNFSWDTVAWDTVAWDTVAWDTVAWDTVAWDTVAWDGDTGD